MLSWPFKQLPLLQQLQLLLRRLGLVGSVLGEQANPLQLLIPKTPPLDLRDSQVDVVRTPAYVYTFMMDKVPLPAMDRVRP